MPDDLDRNSCSSLSLDTEPATELEECVGSVEPAATELEECVGAVESAAAIELAECVETVGSVVPGWHQTVLSLPL